MFPGGALGTFLLPVDQDFVVARGEGSRVYDADGRAYIDYVLASGPMILGHGHPAVVEAITEQATRGTSFYGLNAPAIELADEIVRAVSSAEQVRFCGSGAEATFYGLRLARAHTGRSKVLRFEGAYHGHHDYGMVGASAGIPPALQAEVLTAPFNDAETARRLIRAHRESLAAVIVEPLQRVMSPQPGFLEALREAASDVGAVLVFDEVVTGFRLAYGGAQARYGVTPDLTALGKIIGGGLPLAAVCGRREIMAHADARTKGPGYAYVSGTLSGNALAAAAGLAVLRELRHPGVYERLHAIGETVRSGLREIVKRRSLAAQVVGEGPLFNVILTDRPILSQRALETADRDRSARLGRELLARGLYINLAAKGYMSLAHTDPDLDETLTIFDASLAAIA
ncbi:MAG: aspartate aminotransferase family protein [Candidatus Rokuibacteriota bacterium]